MVSTQMIDAWKAKRDALRARLADNEDFRMLEATDTAIALLREKIGLEPKRRHRELRKSLTRG